jgi:hypothetical protein
VFALLVTERFADPIVSRSESESQFTCAARLPVKSALP